jgi:hypothetical protein
MPTPRGRIIPIVIVAAAGAVAIGVAAIADRIAGQRDRTPAPPGTPQLGGRLPVGLWPADGSEPTVEGGIRGWRRMADHLYHRDTVIDDAARARAIGLATYTRSAADARRQVAFEVSVLRGAYDPAAIAAAWLAPQVPGAEAVEERRAFREFGIGDATIAILEAAESLDTDTGRLAPDWGRQVGLDPARRDFAVVDLVDLDDVERARLAALMIDAALDRIHARGQ